MKLELKLFLITLSGILVSSPLLADQQLDLDGTSITGSKELPNILYIVPWEKPVKGELNEPFSFDIDENLFMPLDRDSFLRQAEYYRKFHSKN